MRQVDYIVVGLGIAGLSICEHLHHYDKKYVVIDAHENAATQVSGGVFNPVVLKRFTAAWKSAEQIQYAIPFYQQLSKKLQVPLVFPTPVWRIFKSVEELNNWMVASDKRELQAFLDSEIINNQNTEINAPFGFGRVKHAGRIDTHALLANFRRELQNNNQIKTETLDYGQLKSTITGWTYKEIEAKKVIFTEGAAVIHNPYFSKELLVPNKGEYIIIKAPDLRLDAILKGSQFVIPLGNELYKVGATFGRGDYSHNTTQQGREEISQKLRTMIRCDFEVVDQVAGVRPTTKDRKPLVGSFSGNKNLVFLSGLGTRGIMGAPWLAQLVIAHLEEGRPIPEEIDINRFYKR